MSSFAVLGKGPAGPQGPPGPPGPPGEPGIATPTNSYHGTYWLPVSNHGTDSQGRGIAMLTDVHSLTVGDYDVTSLFLVSASARVLNAKNGDTLVHPEGFRTSMTIVDNVLSASMEFHFTGSPITVDGGVANTFVLWPPDDGERDKIGLITKIDLVDPVTAVELAVGLDVWRIA